jgi:predicted nuclease of predicted toxin-antitoxin system
MMASNQKNTRRRSKPKLLFDESLPPRQQFPKLNNYCDIKHVRNDLKLSGSIDAQVYSLANQQERLLVTFNIKHFRPMISRDQMSVIGISPNLLTKQIDRKLLSFIRSRDFTAAKQRGSYFKIR